jgi:riboflavin kinase / FMN adenylyltransferase
MGKIRVAHSLEEARAFAPRASAVTLGVFDGVHRGHQSIIRELIVAGKAPGIESTFLITFFPHPVVVTQSREAPPLLSTVEERIDLMERYPLDGVYVVHFDDKVQNTDYRDFIKEYLVDGLQMRSLVLGYDCHFGKNRQGSPESVQAEGRKHGFEVRVVPPLQMEGQIASSTYIRKTLLKGDLDKANALLGHPYTIAGPVERGAGRGRTIGFPTANLRIDHPGKLWPRAGSYAVRVKVDGQIFDGMMNVGTAPTLKGEDRAVEVHIFNFDRDIYGEFVVAYCYAYLREEKRFSSVEELSAQLESDRKTVEDILATSADLV